MDRDQFSRKYGFYCYDEMLYESRRKKDKDGKLWFITTLTITWIAWVDSFPETPQVFTFATLQEAQKHVDSFSRGKAGEQDRLPDLIESYTGKINGTDEPGLKRAYEASREILLRLQQVTNTIGRGTR